MAKHEAFDMTKAMEQFFGGLSVDTKAFDGAIKSASEFNTNLNKIALEAAKKNAEITSAWTAETLAKIESANKVQKDPADYAAVASEFASAQAQALPEKVNAYVEVAKAAQMAAMELFAAAGKDVQKEVAAATKGGK